MFYFPVGGKKVSGLLNIPKKEGNLPVIVLLRGFVEPAKYTTGVGTQHDGEVFVKNGYITIAPDFLGYGESDKAPSDSFEDRFLTYTTVMTLLKSLAKVNPALVSNGYTQALDTSRVGIWGHSNGGQIALSVLEISGKPYPTVLWAPVSKPFPYSILYYTDEFGDNGKALRKALSGFEENYDSEKYSLTNYIGRVTAPMQINQGLADIEVPYWWSDDLTAKLKDLGLTVEYFKYPGEDHNFDKGSWQLAISRSVQFFNDKLKSQ
jgi:dipeptidyl aminopeptidase/acylaminoacyl peptidase